MKMRDCVSPVLNFNKMVKISPSLSEKYQAGPWIRCCHEVALDFITSRIGSRHVLSFTLTDGYSCKALGDPNDWISVRYLVSNGQYAGRVADPLSQARATIIRYADKYARVGPWSKQQFTHLEF